MIRTFVKKCLELSRAFDPLFNKETYIFHFLYKYNVLVYVHFLRVCTSIYTQWKVNDIHDWGSLSSSDRDHLSLPRGLDPDSATGNRAAINGFS